MDEEKYRMSRDHRRSEDFINAYRQKGANTAGVERLLDILARGDFDLVAVGRALIVNWDWANRIRTGEPLTAFDPKALETLDWPPAQDYAPD